jgi:hypothetical protein
LIHEAINIFVFEDKWVTLATIYFAGGEDIDFYTVGIQPWDVGWSTLSAVYRNDWSRGAVSVQNLTNGGSFPDDPNFAHFNVSPTFTPVNDFWFHSQTYILDSSNENGYNALGFGKDNVWRLALQGTGTNGSLKLVKRDSVGVITTLVTSAAGVFNGQGLFGGGMLQFDIHIVYSTTGSITFYLNGTNTPVMTFTGDVTTDGETELNQFFMGTAWSATIYYYSEIIVTDTDSRAMSLLTLPPVANGNTQDWIGTADDINEAQIDDTNFINTDTADEIAEFTCPTTIPFGSWDVQAVFQSGRFNIGLDGPQHFQFVNRPASGSTDYFTANFDPAPAIQNFHYQWPVNPDTGLQWTIADIGAGFNLGVKSIA